MNNLFNSLLIVSVTVAWSTAELPLQKCEGQDFGDLQLRISVDPCGPDKCKLRKGTNTTVSFLFRPEHEVYNLTNVVDADIGVLKLPFIGVTGRSACGQVTRADSGEPAPCPLQPATEYRYQVVFPVESFYPTMNLFKVRWSLNDGTQDVICFIVPASIKSCKSKKKN